MRLTREGCSDLGHPSLTATVYKQTRLRYQYLPGFPKSPAEEPDLGRFPLTFLNPSNGYTNNVALGVPDNPSDSDLRAAMNVAGALSRGGENRPLNLRLVPWSGLPVAAAEGDSVVIGRPGAGPVWDALSNLRSAPIPLTDRATGQFRYGTQAIDRDDGIIEDVPSPWNPNGRTLVVSGATDEAVTKAALSLSGTTARANLVGAGAVVTAKPSAPSEAGTRGSLRDFTLTDLGYGDRMLKGWGLSNVSYVFTTTGVTPPGAKVNLLFSHTKVINPGRSSLVVSLNGVPLLDTQLKADITDRQTLEVQLPPRTLRQGRNILTIQFGLTPLNSGPYEGCYYVPPDLAWGEVFSESSVHLPEGSTGGATLGSFPFPFVRSGAVSDTLIVLPDAAGAMEYGPAIAVELAKSITADVLDIGVTTAGRLTTEQRTTKHLILIGQPQDNRLMGELGDRLPIRVDNTGRVIRGAALDPLAGVRDTTTVGVLQAIVSPFNPSRAILVVTGVSPQSVALAVQGLRSGALSGNAALVTPPLPGEKDPQVKTFDVALGLTVGITAPLVRAQELIPAALSGVISVLVVAILALTGVTAVRMTRVRRAASAGTGGTAEWDDWVDAAEMADPQENR
ncbi:MAG: cellulose biosynthesis cyclic di-GMP-binding regulatory protein BcsB [Chloroflexota bacterium]